MRRRAGRTWRRGAGLLVLSIAVLAGGQAGAASGRVGGRDAGTSITLSRRSGPPTTTTSASGSGFGPSETVAITFDAQVVGSAATDGAGAFSGASIGVPATATPGVHQVTGTGETSGLSAHTPFTVRSNWPQYRFSLTHTGFDPYENVLGPSTVSGLTQAWAVGTGGIVDSSPSVANGVVYVGSEDHSLYAIDAVTGAVRWTAPVQLDIHSSPAISGGTVYVGSFDHDVYAFDASTGVQKWSFATGDLVHSSPAVVAGTVYVGSDDGNVYALNAATGTIKWRAAAGGKVRSSPAVVGGTVYVGSFDHNVYALDAATGAVKWTAPTTDIVGPSPAVWHGVVYVGSFDDSVYAFDAGTGALKWSYATGAFVKSSPAVANGVVYVGSQDDKLYAFDATSGAVLWTVPTGGKIKSSPAVANGIAYVGSGDHKLYAVDAATGSVLWTGSTGAEVDSSPAVSDGRVYVGSLDDQVHAFALPAEPRASRDDPVIAAAGDIACASATPTPTTCHQQATSDLLVAMPLTAVLTLGDDQYEKGALGAYQAFYGPTWGRELAITHPAVGNHEYLTPGASGYFTYFGAAAGDATKGYYSVDIGTWHVVVLNSNCTEIDPGPALQGCAKGSPQESWLRQDLQSSTATCTMAVWHHPRFSSGTHGNDTQMQALWKDLYTSNADVLLVGHDHDYERFAPQNANGGPDPVRGIREFVVGTGGRSHDPFGVPKPNSEVRDNQTFGVLQLTLHPTSYDWVFVPEAGATFTDSGSTACH
jgi:hypothetical protein